MGVAGSNNFEVLLVVLLVIVVAVGLFFYLKAGRG